MIIQIVGTNGAGKSTVVRAVMAVGACHRVQEDKKLLGYYLTVPQVRRQVFVVGPYEAPTGGCDAIKSLGKTYDLIGCAVRANKSVLFEGASHTMNQTRGPVFVTEVGVPFVVVLLTTPLGVCLDGIDARRAERGASSLVSMEHVRSSYKRAQNYAARMREVGAGVVRVSREAAPGAVLELLRG